MVGERGSPGCRRLRVPRRPHVHVVGERLHGGEVESRGHGAAQAALLVQDGRGHRDGRRRQDLAGRHRARDDGGERRADLAKPVDPGEIAPDEPDAVGRRRRVDGDHAAALVHHDDLEEGGIGRLGRRGERAEKRAPQGVERAGGGSQRDHGLPVPRQELVVLDGEPAGERLVAAGRLADGEALDGAAPREHHDADEDEGGQRVAAEEERADAKAAEQAAARRRRFRGGPPGGSLALRAGRRPGNPVAVPAHAGAPPALAQAASVSP